MSPAHNRGRNDAQRRIPARASARRAAVCLGAGCLVAACGSGGPAGGATAGPSAPARAPGAWRVEPAFTDITAASGLDFVHRNGMTGNYTFAEMMGPGGALLDFDNDGDLDVFVVQGRPLAPPAAPGATPLEAPTPDAGDELAWTGRLYRNDLVAGVDGRPAPRLTDVTLASGLRATGYGMAVATGDVDNDGWIDLFLANWGADQLWRNRGDGTFEDVTAASGASDLLWSAGASFLDYDRDGWLDLFVANYVDFTYLTHHPCYTEAGGLDYCGPEAYRPSRDRLLHNRGDGTFDDVSEAMGLAAADGPGLAAAAADLDGDGWTDLYVANDQTENLLWRNDAGRQFANVAPSAGVAVNRDGLPEASMGIAAADLDNDADLDLFVTDIRGDMNTLYLNDGRGTFRDVTGERGLGPPSRPFTAFGAADIDIDMDGWLDLAIVNGEVRLVDEQLARGEPFPLRQTALVMRNIGAASFVEATSGAGPAFGVPAVGRGLAAGDIDNDGDADLLLADNNGPARLLQNDAGNGSAWLGLRLVTGPGRRDALGATARLLGPGGPAGVRLAHTDGSYASARDPRVVFAVGPTSAPSEVEVRWPDGTRERWPGLAVGRYHTLAQGEGEPLP